MPLARLLHIQDEETFGEYRVIEVLGHGAMGLVYRARDPRLHRLVALKIVHPGRVSKDVDKARARLVSEARALARLSHPNVLAVYDVGVQDDVVFVALELVDGIDLAHWLRARRRSWKDVVAVFMEAAAGLAAVHAAGLVHRDVKPANILVEHAPRGRAFGRVLVADFGIARETETPLSVTVPGDVSSSREIDASLTEEGRVVGTPAYMAPEQHLGLEATAAADQYALCVSLYEGLYGKRPFGGDPWTLLGAKSEPLPDAPPNAEVPAWLWPILCRGLASRPADRFPAMTDLLAALRNGPPRRGRTVLAGAAAIAIAGLPIAGSLGHERQCRRARVQVDEVWNDARREAIGAAFSASGRPEAAQTWARSSERIDAHARELATMYEDACEAARVRDDDREALFDRRIACLESRKQDLSQALALLARGEADIVDHADDVVALLEPSAACGDLEWLEVGIDPPRPEQREVVADVRGAIAEAEALHAAGRYVDAAAEADAALERARELDYVPVLVEALTLAGELRERQSRIDEARAALDEALSRGLEIGHDRIVARAANLRIWIAGSYDRDVEAAEEYGALARAQLRRVGDPPGLAVELHTVLGSAYSAAGRYEDALREFERGLVRVEEDPELAAWKGVMRSNIGHAQIGRGDLEGARASYQSAVDIFRAQQGGDHPNVASAELRLAQVLELSGRHHEAIAGLRRAIASFERMQAAPDELATALVTLGQALRAVGEDEEANTTYRRAVELLATTGDHYSLGFARVAYGQSCLARGIYDAAEDQFERAIELLEPLGAIGDQLRNAWIGLGLVREKQSRQDEALSLYRRAYEADPKTPIGASALVDIAMLHHRAGRHAEASATLDRREEIVAAVPGMRLDDRIPAAMARVRIMVDGGRAMDAAAAVDALEALLTEAREGGGSRWLGEGDLVVGLALIARQQREAGCARVAQANDALAIRGRAEVAAEARAALATCER